MKRILFYSLSFLGPFHLLMAQSDSLINRHALQDTGRAIYLEEVVVSASKQEERLLQAPVSIEQFNLHDIRLSAQPSFFDALEGLKGVQMITPSLGFKVVNARGFANTTNVRFVQMVDGMDNQAPHIGAPIANAMGPNDLDIYRVEVVPGSASAMYGMNAINGIAQFVTKDPFLFPGLSVQHKTGVNNINNSVTRTATPFLESSVRFAKSYRQKWGFKLNGAYLRGVDWYAHNQGDLNPNANSSTQLVGEANPGKDMANTYGDEASSNSQKLKLGGKQYTISRTGYAEKDVTDYRIENTKGDLSLYYRPIPKVEVSYVYRFAYLNTTYQRTNRFNLSHYLTQQHGVTVKSSSVQLRTYLTSENTGDSYNIRSMAENMDRSFKSDKQWGLDFTNQFNKGISLGLDVPTAMRDARANADAGRPMPGTPFFRDEMDRLRDINNWDFGAALRVKAKLYHAEAQHNLTQQLIPSLQKEYKLQLMYGADYRTYAIAPDGNYFINPTSEGQMLLYWKYGGFLQATKYFLRDRLKINAVLRLDKNQFFNPTFNPRLALVYSPVQSHNFRFSFQNGYRFPSIFEAFSNINSGGVKRVGGLPVMSSGIFENSYLGTSITAFQSAVASDVNNRGMTTKNAIAQEQKLLKKNPYTYLRPEQVTSWEGGYRTRLMEGKLYLDVDGYYNVYRHLMAQVNAAIPKTTDPDSVATYLNDKSKQSPYRLWTNSQTISYNYGGTVGITYLLPRQFKLAGNFTYAKLDKKENQDGLEDGFNTPEWIWNVSIANPQLLGRLGFMVNLRRQSNYLWQSALASGDVPAYTTLDAQVGYALFKSRMRVKLGGTNLLNQYYYSFLAGPSIGGFYYVSIVYEGF